MSAYSLPPERLQRIFLVVTDACNARCKLCSYWQATPGSAGYLSHSFIKDRVISLIKQYEVQAVCITGGEPTLNPELPQVLETIKQTGVVITLVTNGSYSDQLFQQIKCHVQAWLFSLDADNEILYRQLRGLDNFAELMAWPEKIRAANPDAQIAFNCLIQKQNVRSLVRLYRLICDLPCEGLFFNVPDLNSHSFSRKGRHISPGDMEKYVLLDAEEMEILHNNLAEILELDNGRCRGKIMQSESFFKNCLNYFAYLREKKVTFKDKDIPCVVPETSLVVDESGVILPCFYLPPGFGDLLPHQQEELKEKYCSRCFQFQG